MPEKIENEISGFTVSATSGDTFHYQCPICLDYASEESLFTLCTCGCLFCKKCLVNYITTAMDLFYDHDLRCPGFNCPRNGQLTDSEIFSLVSLHIYQRYEARKRQRAIDKDSLLTYCPRNECSTVCRIPSPLTSPLHTRVPLRSDGLESQRRKGHLFQRLYSLLTQKVTGSELKKFFDWGFDYAKGQQTTQESPTLQRPALPVICPKCGFHFCARCHHRWHSGQPPYPCDWQTRRRRERLGKPFRIFCRQQMAALKQILMPYFSSSIDPKPVENQSVPENVKDKLLGGQIPAPSVHIFIGESDGLGQPMKSGYPDDQSEKPDVMQEKTVKRMSGLGDRLVKQCNGEFNQALMDLPVGFPPYPADAQYKRCPICFVPVERMEGCAQMCCHSCKRTFCWYCLTSLDTDILLRHFDSGSCRGKLGHSSGSLLRHRFCVVLAIVIFLILAVISAPIALIILVYLTCVDVYQVKRLRRRRRTVEYYLHLHLLARKESPGAFQTHSLSLPISTVTETRPVAKADAVERALIHWSSENDASKGCTDDDKTISTALDEVAAVV